MNTNKKTDRQKSKGNAVVSIILFVLTGLTVIFAARQFIYCHEDVLSAIDQGMTLIDNLGDIIFYYLESCGQYLFTGAILFALGWIIIRQEKTAEAAASLYQADTQRQKSDGDANSEASEKLDETDGIDEFAEEKSGEK